MVKITFFTVPASFTRSTSLSLWAARDSGMQVKDSRSAMSFFMMAPLISAWVFVVILVVILLRCASAEDWPGIFLTVSPEIKISHPGVTINTSNRCLWRDLYVLLL